LSNSFIFFILSANSVEAIKLDELHNRLYVGTGMMANTSNGRVECIDLNQDAKVIALRNIKGLVTDIEYVPSCNNHSIIPHLPLTLFFFLFIVCL